MCRKAIIQSVLRIGVTWPTLNMEVNLPSENDNLACWAMGGPKTSPHPLKIIVGMKSMGDVLDDIFWMVTIASDGLEMTK